MVRKLWCKFFVGVFSHVYFVSVLVDGCGKPTRRLQHFSPIGGVTLFPNFTIFYALIYIVNLLSQVGHAPPVGAHRLADAVHGREGPGSDPGWFVS